MPRTVRVSRGALHKVEGSALYLLNEGF